MNRISGRNDLSHNDQRYHVCRYFILTIKQKEKAGIDTDLAIAKNFIILVYGTVKFEETRMNDDKFNIYCKIPLIRLPVYKPPKYTPPKYVTQLT